MSVVDINALPGLIDHMAAQKGRRHRERSGTNTLLVRIGEDVRKRLDDGAAALGISLAAYLEQLVRHIEVDEGGLPAWARAQVEAEQLPLEELKSA